MDNQMLWTGVHHLNALLEECMSLQDHFGADRFSVDFIVVPTEPPLDAKYNIQILENFKFSYKVKGSHYMENPLQFLI